jgi:hypothetical protein
MRPSESLLLAAILLACPALHAATKHAGHAKAAAAAAPACEFPADRAAFDIEGLKSELMVTALTCRDQDKYNDFMRRYQPDVAREEHDLSAYFKRAYGRQYQKAYDDYISNLANVQSQDTLKAGNAFCANLPAMFDEVMSLHDSSELHDYANSKVIAQPVAFETCTSPPPASPSTAKAHRSSKLKHT